MLNERDGRILLKNHFQSAGFIIQDDYPLTAFGLSVAVDGFDPDERVGYEYLSAEDGARGKFSEETLARLETLIHEGALSVFLIDEIDDVDAELLTEAADAFLATHHARRKS